MKIKTLTKACVHSLSLRCTKTMFAIFTFFLLSLSVSAQSIAIKGTVSEASGDAAIGVSVLVKGSSTGAVTNMDGDYIVNVADENATLVFSFLGFLTQEVTVGNQRTINITMREDLLRLDDVVVVGYGVQRKSDLTGAVASIKAANALNTLPAGNITDALQGRLSGVSILSGSGDPSKDNTIRIRGMNSISGDKGPLVVVDGFIGGSLQALTPSDIESIEVLKDASATAVYGSRGGNGVILVTTKTPTKETVINFSSFVSIKKIAEKPDMLSPYETAMLSNDYGQEYFASLTNDEKIALKQTQPKVYYTADQLKAYKDGKAGYNYFNGVLNDPALSQNYELSLASGGDKTNLLASVRYNKTEGIVKANQKEMYNYRLKADTKVKSWLTVGVNLSGYYSTHKSPRSEFHQGIIQAAMYYPNTVDPFINGKYQHLLPMRNLGNVYNPLAHATENRNISTTLSTNLLGYADFKILDGLTFRTSIGVNFDNNNNRSNQTEQGFDAITANNPVSSAYSRELKDWLNSNILSYVKEFNEDHRVNLTAVYEQSKESMYNHKSTSRGLYFPGITGENALQSGDPAKMSVESNKYTGTLQSWMVRANYVFKNKYMITASIRGDGSSRLAKKWAYFPSVAVAWDIKQENFLKDANNLSQLKLRVGYGSVGNQAIENYRRYSMMENTAGKMTPGRPAGDDLKWEKNNQTNIGLDAGFWKGRLTVNLDWYKKVTKDVLLPITQPQHMGFGSILRNAGEIENQGFEVTISADPVSTKNFSWHTDVTLAFNKGKFTKIPTLNRMHILTENDGKIVRVIEGENIATFWGYNYMGVWQEADLDALFIGADGNPTNVTNREKYQAKVGQARYEDKNKDGVYGDPDKGKIGNGQPKFNWGWNNTFKYRNFDLSLFIIGFHGFDIYNATDQIGYGLLNGQNVDEVTPKRALLNRWTVDNKNTNVPAFMRETRSTFDFYSNRFVEKGAFIRMKSITIGYSLPQRICNKIHLKNLRVYASVINPFTITDYKGLDPESALGTPLTQGVDWGAYPNSRDFVFGLNFSF